MGFEYCLICLDNDGWRYFTPNRIGIPVRFKPGLFGPSKAVRFILKLIEANPENPFAQLVYNLSYLFLWPFLDLTASPAVGGMVLEIPSLIAMLVYALLASVLIGLIQLFANRSSTRSISVREQSR